MLNRSQPCGMSLTKHGAVVHTHFNALKFGRNIMHVVSLFLCSSYTCTIVLTLGLFTEICNAFRLDYTRKIIVFQTLDSKVE